MKRNKRKCLLDANRIEKRKKRKKKLIRFHNNLINA